jgi:aspartyl-tRNA(Asn)/glutamyl-tRNA(Gln) amidotransferase subunit A
VFLFKSIADYHKDLYSGKATCLETVNFYLNQIAVCKRLNAFVEVYSKESIARAQYLDEKRIAGAPCGKLHGIVIAIKDVICYKNHKVTASSGILNNYISIFNSTAVERLMMEDAIIIGSCNCDEFAMGSTNENSVYGRVLNALDESKVPGGSSGGSAVAVQAGLCMVSLGSDTGGSVRQPADFCGIVGIKPSYGSISRNGLIAYASSFDQIGVFSINVEDAVQVLDVIKGSDLYDSTVSHHKQTGFSGLFSAKNNKPGGYRVALLKNALAHKSLDREIKNSIYSLADDLKNEGHKIEEIEFSLIDFIVPTYYVLTTAEASSNLSRYDGVRYGYRYKNNTADVTSFYKKTRSNGFGKEVKRRIMLGTFVLSEGYYDAYYTKAQQIRRLLIDQTKSIFENFDVLLLPTTPSTAFAAGSMQKDPVAMYLADIYTVYANLTGTPAISLPLFKHSNGMPFGVQVVANNFDELTLLQFSNLLMKSYKRQYTS